MSDPVEAELVDLLNTLNEAMKTMENLTAETKPILVECAGKMVESFKKLHSLEDSVEGEVPYELLEIIDNNSNPDKYSARLIEECQGHAKSVEEKRSYVQSFHDSLSEQIRLNFPDEE